MSAGTRADHHQFCRTEKWEAVLGARGGKVRHHITYELLLLNGRRLRTRVSRPDGNTTYGQRTYGQSLWKAILRDQLEVTEDAFWSCVKHKQLPHRGQDTEPDLTGSLPAGLVYQLIHVAHVPEDEVMKLSLDEANAQMTEHWSRPQK